MDVPGHSTGLIAALPGQYYHFTARRSVAKCDPEKLILSDTLRTEPFQLSDLLYVVDVFGFPSAPKLGIANFANATVIKRLQKLLDEIGEVLPSPFVAIGGDEVSFPAVENLPEVVAAVKERRLMGVGDLYRLFIVEMQAYAVSKNKTLRVWVSCCYVA